MVRKDRKWKEYINDKTPLFKVCDNWNVAEERYLVWIYKLFFDKLNVFFHLLSHYKNKTKQTSK